MRKNPASQSGIFNPRVLLAFALCSVGVLLAMLSFAATPLTPATATGQWNIVTSPNGPDSQVSYLEDVACTSASNCWAVGWYYDASNQVKTLIEHFDGTNWTIVSAPAPSNAIGPATQDLLTSVTCVNENSCWAVGYFTEGVNVHTFTDHYTGTGWVFVSTTDPANSRDSELRSVSCVSDNDCWAVGMYQAPGVFSLTPSSVAQTLFHHWDGTSWTMVSSPNETIPMSQSNPTGQTTNYPLSVSCTGPNDCWAAGWFYNAQGIGQTLIQHYNGSAWSIVSSPNIGFSFLQEITCASAGDCWGVGLYFASGPSQTLIEHYDGTAWSIVPSPNNPNGQNNRLYGATCASSSDCWATGVQYSDDSNYMTGEGNSLTLTEHWDGTSWSIVNSTNTGPDDSDELVAVSCVNAIDCWAVGGAADTSGVARTLIEHYTVSVPPVPTSVVSRKTHGSAGDFDIDLPLAGNPGIECRTGGANNDYQIVVTFANAVTFNSAAVTSGTGTVASTSGSGTTTITVNLTSVSNAQTITLTLSSVNDGTTSGEVNANAAVSNTDVAAVKADVSSPVTASNFRNDVTANGIISNTDVSATKAQVGTSLP
jgi:hypothetical protein